MMTFHSKNQYTPIVNSTQNCNPNPPGDWMITDHFTNDHALKVEGTLEVNGRDVMREIDEMRDALLLLKRDVDMEAKYPELKQAYDEYRKILDELIVMGKLTT
jgi:hypothetical protein